MAQLNDTPMSGALARARGSRRFSSKVAFETLESRTLLSADLALLVILEVPASPHALVAVSAALDHAASPGAQNDATDHAEVRIVIDQTSEAQHFDERLDLKIEAQRYARDTNNSGSGHSAGLALGHSPAGNDGTFTAARPEHSGGAWSKEPDTVGELSAGAAAPPTSPHGPPQFLGGSAASATSPKDVGGPQAAQSPAPAQTEKQDVGPQVAQLPAPLPTGTGPEQGAAQAAQTSAKDSEARVARADRGGATQSADIDAMPAGDALTAGGAMASDKVFEGSAFAFAVGTGPSSDNAPIRMEIESAPPPVGRGRLPPVIAKDLEATGLREEPHGESSVLNIADDSEADQASSGLPEPPVAADDMTDADQRAEASLIRDLGFPMPLDFAAAFERIAGLRGTGLEAPPFPALDTAIKAALQASVGLTAGMVIARARRRENGTIGS